MSGMDVTGGGPILEVSHGGVVPADGWVSKSSLGRDRQEPVAILLHQKSLQVLIAECGQSQIVLSCPSTILRSSARACAGGRQLSWQSTTTSCWALRRQQSRHIQAAMVVFRGHLCFDANFTSCLLWPNRPQLLRQVSTPLSSHTLFCANLKQSVA